MVQRGVMMRVQDQRRWQTFAQRRQELDAAERKAREKICNMTPDEYELAHDARDKVADRGVILNELKTICRGCRYSSAPRDPSVFSVCQDVQNVNFAKRVTKVRECGRLG